MEVIYERDPDVGNGYQAFRGRMQWSGGSTEFQHLHFEALMRQVAELLPAEDCSIIFFRSDKPTYGGYQLPTDLVYDVKTNVEMAISKMSHPDIRIVLGRLPESQATLTSCGLTLADAFGRRVAVRLRETDAYYVECPGCGKWVKSPAPTPDGADLSCPCGMNVPIFELDDQWVSVNVHDLLQQKFDRFFMPRAWNAYKPWVAAETLIHLLRMYEGVK